MYWKWTADQPVTPRRRLIDREYVATLIGRKLKRYEQIHHHPTGELVVCPTPLYHNDIHCEMIKRGSKSTVYADKELVSTVDIY